MLWKGIFFRVFQIQQISNFVYFTLFERFAKTMVNSSTDNSNFDPFWVESEVAIISLTINNFSFFLRRTNEHQFLHRLWDLAFCTVRNCIALPFYPFAVKVEWLFTRLCINIQVAPFLRPGSASGRRPGRSFRASWPATQTISIFYATQ